MNAPLGTWDYTLFNFYTSVEVSYGASVGIAILISGVCTLYFSK